MSGRASIRLGLALSACSHAGPRPASGVAPTPESRIYDSKAGRFITLPMLMSAVRDADVIFFGEQHDDPATHRAELAYLAAIGATRPNVVLSLEMFERDVQGVLDAYLRGATTDSLFLATSRPWPNYVKDYRPMVELARSHGWPVIASNVPRRIASSVGRAGLALLDTIPQTDRAFAARDVSCPRDKYYERFADEMSGHSAGGITTASDSAALASTNRFYEAQCVKDETMAESIVAALDRAGHGAVVVHFDGAFHSNMGLGTVARVQRRKPGARTVVITAVPVDAVTTADARTFAELADYIVLTPKTPRH
ncbi:MAG: ChaN family lipoprotein [Longimicrobiales bacterium]